MALRVLLADESTSIKKVMQLALQDFGVEVKAVPLGIDVLPVAKSWNPDIVFVDVLLAKRSGYEVCAELKNDPLLSKIPTVLIWSSFMDIDEKKASSCGAARRLEKPFDAETLRGIIKDLVPSTSSNTISSYLSFPNLPDFVEKPKPPPLKPPTVNPSANQTTDYSANRSIGEVTDRSIDLGDIDEPEDFRQVPLPRVSPELSTSAKFPPGHNSPSRTASFSGGGVDRFKINIPTEDYSNLEEEFADVDDAHIALAGAGKNRNEVQLADLDNDSSPPVGFSSSPGFSGSSNGPGALDPTVVEQVLREQVRAVLQDIAWKIIPDIAERIVREEIQKLLKDAEKLS